MQKNYYENLHNLILMLASIFTNLLYNFTLDRSYF